MKITRRNALLTTLFGAGGVGLRALATGLPVSFFLDPRKAMAAGPDAGCGTASKAQYIVFSTAERGCPLNAGAPGTYGIPNIVHAPQTASSGTGLNMTETPLTLNGTQTSAAFPWSTLPQNVLDRTVFFHLATNTPIHPSEPLVLKLGTSTGEMLPSLLAKAVAPSLNTIQPQPVCLGAPITYSGQPLPLLPPSSLGQVLTNPTYQGLAKISRLQLLRDQTMSDIYNIYYKSGTPTQRAYISTLANTQKEARNISQALLGQLSMLSTDQVLAQIQAAVILIQMNVAPVFVVWIPFGSDNHADKDLTTEATDTNSGVGYIATLFQLLQAAGLQDKVSFMTLNVFGRTLSTNQADAGQGRSHNGNHQVSVCIGAPFKGGIIGGCGPVKNALASEGDFGALNIDPSTGKGLPGEAGVGIALEDTLTAYAQTTLAAVGGCPSVVGGTSNVVTAALA